MQIFANKFALYIFFCINLHISNKDIEITYDESKDLGFAEVFL